MQNWLRSSKARTETSKGLVSNVCAYIYVYIYMHIHMLYFIKYLQYNLENLNNRNPLTFAAGFFLFK